MIDQLSSECLGNVGASAILRKLIYQHRQAAMMLRELAEVQKDVRREKKRADETPKRQADGMFGAVGGLPA
jgi:hypothetical protein